MIDRVLSKLKNKPRLFLASRINLSLIPLYLITMIILFIIIQSIFHSLFLDKFKEDAEFTEHLVLQQVSKFLENVNTCANSIIISTNTLADTHATLLADLSDSSGQHSDFLQTLNYTLINHTYMFSEAAYVSIILNDGFSMTVYSGSLETDIKTDLSISTRFQAVQADSSGKWIYNARQIGYKSDFIFIKPLMSLPQYQSAGYVVIGIDDASMNYLNPAESNTDGTHFIVLGSEQNVISSTFQADTEQTDMFIKLYTDALTASDVEFNSPGLHEQASAGTLMHGSDNLYYRFSHVPGTEWSTLSVFSYRQVNESMRAVITLIILALILLVGVYAFIIIIISSKMTKPLKLLSEHMLRFDNTVPYPINDSFRNDEIGILAKNYNTMINKNLALFERIKNEEASKRHLELALVQAQIKPHFLYNTLDTVYCLIETNDNQQAQKVIRLITDFYRYVLNKGQEWITLDEEIKSVIRYMNLQNIRFNQLFEYKIDIAPELMLLQIPHLTIQPLVENAIYHGIQPLSGSRKGQIIIKGEWHPDKIIISVIDNGCGMSQAEFDRIITGQTPETKESFGLKNIAERIKLFYGTESQLILSSGKNQETILSIVIRQEENN